MKKIRLPLSIAGVALALLLGPPAVQSQEPAAPPAQETPQQTDDATLPRTASDLPAIAVLGAVAMVGAAAVRRIRALD